MKYQKSPTYLGMIEILDGKIRFKVGKVRGTTSGNNVNKLPLARSKCEELANYYLGFNGWSSQVLYHRKEETDPGELCYVTVIKLLFPQVYN